MTKRQALLVGSLPFANERVAMATALSVLNESLFSLPDGEVGKKLTPISAYSRSAWIMYLLQICSDNTEAWEIAKQGEYGEDGFPLNYKTIRKLRPKFSPKKMIDHLDFHYLKHFQESYPIFQQLRAKQERDDLKFQVGIPTGLALTSLILPPVYILRYINLFNQRLAFEVNEMYEQAKEDLLIQIEMPIEVGFAEMLPKRLRGLILKSVFQLVKSLNPAIPIGIHLCFGDFRNKALTRPKTIDKLVKLTNGLIRKWPQTHLLKYIHFPFAEGEYPPTLEIDYYSPLQQLEIPKETRFVAGFVHEKRSNIELEQILKMIDGHFDQAVDIACSCGLGRRDTRTALLLMRKIKELVDE